MPDSYVRTLPAKIDAISDNLTIIIRQSVVAVNEDKQYVHQNVALRFNVSTFDHRDCGEIVRTRRY